jgi:recombinational DNA repair protein RecT
MENKTQQPTTANIMQRLNATPARDIPMIPEVEQKFVQLYAAIHGVGKETAEMTFHAERFHFLKLVNSNQEIAQCEGLSLYGCFMDCAVNGLSFDPTKKLAYVLPGNVNVGTRDTPQWVKRATLVVSPYGEMGIRQRDGQIKHADNPVVVYEGDEFQPYQDGGKKGIHYKLNMGHTQKVVAGFIRIVRTDGTEDYFWMLQEDIARLAAASAKKNRGTANSLYTSQNGGIDAGFFRAKLIKHAFQSYPKVSLRGLHTKDEEQIKLEQRNNEVDYGLASISAPTALPAHQEQAPTSEPSDAAKRAAIAATAEEMGPAETLKVDYSDDGSGF